MTIIEQGKEPADFWSLVGKSADPYGNVNDWNNLLVNVSNCELTFQLATHNFVKEAPMAVKMQDYKDDVQEE